MSWETTDKPSFGFRLYLEYLVYLVFRVIEELICAILRYECEFGDEIPVQISGDLQNDLTVNSQRFHDVFEKWLRESPEQGFWMHRKFRRKSKRVKPGTTERDGNCQETRSEMRSYGQRRHEGF